MVSFYGGLADTAAKLLKSKGQQVTFTRRVEAVFDPVAGVDTYGSTSTFTGNGVIVPLSKDKVNGVMATLILEATTTSPEIGDAVTASGVDYVIEEIDILSPAGTVVLYEIGLRK